MEANGMELEQRKQLDVHIEEAGYKENEASIRNIFFSVEKGKLVGLIGPNGAGKSTTIKSIMSLTPYRKGNVQLGDGNSGTYAYVPEQPIYYDYFTLWEHLWLAASVNNIDKQLFEQRAERLLEKFKLTEQKHHYPGSFSKGMQQKLMLMIAFMLEPDLYIVDEPFIGLDPQATLDFISLLNDARQQGAAVLMSTHVLDSAERLCDTFICLHHGEIVAKGDMEQLRAQAGLTNEHTLFDCFHAFTSDATDVIEC